MNMEIFLMVEGESIDEITDNINKTDGDKLRKALGIKKENDEDTSEDTKPLKFQSKRVWNLKRWGEKNTKEIKWCSYPTDSASQNYANVMDIHFTAK